MGNESSAGRPYLAFNQVFGAHFKAHVCIFLEKPARSFDDDDAILQGNKS